MRPYLRGMDHNPYCGSRGVFKGFPAEFDDGSKYSTGTPHSGWQVGTLLLPSLLCGPVDKVK